MNNELRNKALLYSSNDLMNVSFFLGLLCAANYILPMQNKIHKAAVFALKNCQLLTHNTA